MLLWDDLLFFDDKAMEKIDDNNKSAKSVFPMIAIFFSFLGSGAV